MTDEIVKSRIIAEYTQDEFKPVEDIVGNLIDIIEFQNDKIRSLDNDDAGKVEERVQEDIDKYIDYLEEQLSKKKVKLDDVAVEIRKPRIGRESMEELAHTMQKITNEVLKYALDTEEDLQVFYGREFDENQVDVNESYNSDLSIKPNSGLWTSPLSNRADIVSEWQHFLRDRGWDFKVTSNKYHLFKVKEGINDLKLWDRDDIIQLGKQFTDIENFEMHTNNFMASDEDAYMKSINWDEVYETFDSSTMMRNNVEPWDLISTHFKNMDFLENIGKFTKHETTESLSMKSSDTIIDIKTSVGLPVTEEDLEIQNNTGRRYTRSDFDESIMMDIQPDTDTNREEVLDTNIEDPVVDVDNLVENIEDEEVFDNNSNMVKQSFIPAIKYHDIDEDQGSVIDLTNVNIGSMAKEITVYLGIIDIVNNDELEVTDKIKSIVGNYLILYLKQLLTIAQIYR